MNIGAVNHQIINSKPQFIMRGSNRMAQIECPKYANYSSANVRANFLPISFRGNTSEVKNAFIITDDKDIPLLKTKENGSYVIDFDSQTEVVYGKNAISYLDKTDKFTYDTQIIIPKKCEGELVLDGKTIPLPENSAAIVNANTNAKVKIKKGFPMVIFSKNDYDWYEHYGKNAKNENIKNKFLELMYFNSHLYNGDFPPTLLLPDELKSNDFLHGLGLDKYQSGNNLIYDLSTKRDMLQDDARKKFDKAKSLLDKMYEKNIIEAQPNGYIRFNKFYNDEFQEKFLKEKGFTDDEIAEVMPIFHQTKTVHADSRFVKASSADGMSQALISRLKENGILHNNKKNLDKIYWKETFGNEENLRNKLSECGFSDDEKNEVVKYWHEANNTGFDISGLKFINNDVAVYNLNDKLNNWTLEKTNWVSNSTALNSSDGKTPFIGVSLVQADDKNIYEMSELRKGEKLHKHPNLAEKRQTEMYLITSGAAALTIIKNGKPTIKILKEGDLAIIAPAVEHCVNSVLGEYEQIVAQVPSAFQYGFDFKCLSEEPEGYNEQELMQSAKSELEKIKDEK